MRDMGPLAAALLLTVLAHLGLPLPVSDPLRSTLVLLPLMMAALIGIARWAESKGGQTTPRTVVITEVAVLFLLIVITVGRGQLGLGPADLVERCLAGAFVSLLAHRLWRLIRALQPSLGATRTAFAPSVFFVLPLVVYLAILPWTSTQREPDGDAPHYLLLTHSLAWDYDSDLRNNYAQGDSLEFMNLRLEPQLGDPTGTQGELYSRHNILLPLLLAPFYRLGGLFAVLVAMAAITAATGWATLCLARHYEPTLPAESVLAWAILAFTAPFLLFSYQVWVEIPAALLVVVGLLQIHQLRREEGTSWWNWALLGASVALLPLLKIRFLLIALPLASLALWQGSRRSRALALLMLISLVALAGGILLFNQQVFQNPLKYHDIDGLRTYSQPAGNYLRGLVGLFFDCAFGLFANTPIWMLLMPALFVVAKQRRASLVDFGIVFLPYLVLLAPRGEWFGAWSPPYRYGVVMLPVLTLWLIPLLKDRRRAGSQTVIVVLLVASLALTMLWLVVPGWTFNFAHGRSHLLDQLSTHVAADVARFFPSSTRFRTATLVWPPLALLSVTLVWMRLRKLPSRTTAIWAVALALLAPPLLVWSSQHRTTRIVEFEDPWLGQQEGFVYPDQWVVYRPRYRGGWTLPGGASIELPAVAGGDRLDLRVDLRVNSRRPKRVSLEVRDHSGRILDRSIVDVRNDWSSLTFQDLAWTTGESLTLTLHAPRTHTGTLDRAAFTWRQ